MGSLLRSFFLIRNATWPRTATVAWVAVAIASLSVATAIALRPGQLADLTTIREWMQYWLTTGSNPYLHFNIAPKLDGYESTLDYPPIAFLLLWPIGRLSESALLATYFPATIALLAVAGWLLTAWISELLGITLRRQERVALVAMLLASDGAHLTLWHGQAVAPCFVFAAVALHQRARHPWIAALALALCSFKPHVAVGVGVVLLLERRAMLVIRAVAVTLMLSWVFAASVGRSLFGILTDYASNLRLMYLGTHRVRGMLSVWFALEDVTGSYTEATALYVILAITSLALLVRWSWHRRHDGAGRALAAASTILWSLLFFPHQRYDVLLAAPALWLLMWPEAGVFRRESTRVALVAGYVIFSTMDIPVLMRAASGPNAALYWQSYALPPLSMSLLLGLTMAALARTPATDTA